MKNKIEIIEYKKLIRSNNQYCLKLPATIMNDLNYNRNTDTFRIEYNGKDLIIKLIREEKEVGEKL